MDHGSVRVAVVQQPPVLLDRKTTQEAAVEHLHTAAHRTLDVAGHYGRNEVFHLTVDRAPRPPITWS